MKVEISRETLDLVLNTAINDNTSVRIHKQMDNKNVLYLSEENVNEIIATMDSIISDYIHKKFLQDFKNKN